MNVRERGTVRACVHVVGLERLPSTPLPACIFSFVCSPHFPLLSLSRTYALTYTRTQVPPRASLDPTLVVQALRHLPRLRRLVLPVSGSALSSFETVTPLPTLLGAPPPPPPPVSDLTLRFALENVTQGTHTWLEPLLPSSMRAFLQMFPHLKALRIVTAGDDDEENGGDGEDEAAGDGDANISGIRGSCCGEFGRIDMLFDEIVELLPCLERLCIDRPFMFGVTNLFHLPARLRSLTVWTLELTSSLSLFNSPPPPQQQQLAHLHVRTMTPRDAHLLLPWLRAQPSPEALELEIDELCLRLKPSAMMTPDFAPLAPWRNARRGVRLRLVNPTFDDPHGAVNVAERGTLECFYRMMRPLVGSPFARSISALGWRNVSRLTPAFVQMCARVFDGGNIRELTYERRAAVGAGGDTSCALIAAALCWPALRRVRQEEEEEEDDDNGNALLPLSAFAQQTGMRLEIVRGRRVGSDNRSGSDGLSRRRVWRTVYM